MKYIVMDLEMNPVDWERKEIRQIMKDEVIEIGAVKLDEDFQVIDEFQGYVKPQYGEVRRHIAKLTGITNDTVKDAPDFLTRYGEFVHWVGNEAVTLYSWSDSDIKQLQSECRLKCPQDTGIQFLAAHWVDLQKSFDDRLGLHNSLALKHALGAIDHKFEGTQHTALADAFNTSSILVLMQDDQAFHEKMQPVLELLQPKAFASSIGDLCPELLNLHFEGK